jgi:ornithine cyclodeaminase/alanine dehydrogenase-like protein (mu-crystallin family)
MIDAWRLSEGAFKSMKAWVPADPTESSTPKPSTRRGVLEKFLRWLAEIGRPVNSVTKLFFRPRHPASQFTAEQRAEGGAEEAGAVVTPTENGVADLTIAKVEAGAQINSPAATVPDQDEIQRRRDLVRMLFNDFWSGTYEKPAAFVERLNQAEDYLNERLTANGEVWRLDATTRAMLGLPPRSSSPD